MSSCKNKSTETLGHCTSFMNDSAAMKHIMGWVCYPSNITSIMTPGDAILQTMWAVSQCKNIGGTRGEYSQDATSLTRATVSCQPIRSGDIYNQACEPLGLPSNRTDSSHNTDRRRETENKNHVRLTERNYSKSRRDLIMTTNEPRKCRAAQNTWRLLLYARHFEVVCNIVTRFYPPTSTFSELGVIVTINVL